MKKKMGRPPKDETGPKRMWLQIRVESSEKDAMRSAADADGESLSDWARKILLRAAKHRK